ncbi:SpaA isopeptide-forming pilin-related protein [Actinotignum urinale]|uniref:SpaA isopeptide-forming pilin-related protein n=1 Tax=Actinotignum urinale TaxID=190146 RepID=UPI002A80C598|nr:SpaA isopeptide-forming pilin-related protein [Actinotignum urinale]MDY5129288.1 SpaA isopeptide-forming pilin-related protein [Actinotignum urinale]
MKHSSKLAFILLSNWQGWLLRGVSVSLLVVILAVTGAAGAEAQSGFSSQPQNGASETVVQEPDLELSSESVSPPPPVATEGTASPSYCQPGRYYSIDVVGNVRARSDPNVNIPGDPLPAFPKFPAQSNDNQGELIQANALGIAPDGTAYALAIYGNNKQWVNGYLTWGPASNIWIEIRKRAPIAGAPWEYVATLPSKHGESWVAGGVDPLTGTYYFGQFTESTVEVQRGQEVIPIAFKLYKLENGIIKYVGLIHPQTELRRSGNLEYINKFILNGDLSFDVLGNLHILSGHPLGADLWTVSKERLDGLNGGEITSDTVVQNRFAGSVEVLGVSFNANGLLWISGEWQHFTFNPTTNTMKRFGNPLNQGYAETDLGSCVTPPTLGVKKVLNGPRISDEQFKLSVDNRRSDGSLDEYTVPVTTTGEQDDVQGQVATVVVGKATYKISESIVHQPKPNDAGQVTLDMFKSSLSCTDQNGKEYIANKEARDDWLITVPESVSVTKPGTGERENVVANIKCTLTNTPRKASVAWSKVDDSTPAQPVSGSQWKITGPFKTNLDVTDCVADSAQECAGPDKDPAAGKFKVENLNFGEYKLSETKAPQGYQIPGDSNLRTFTVGPGVPNYVFDKAFVNPRIKGKVTWAKVDESKPNPQYLAGSQWKLDGPDGAKTVTDCVAQTPQECTGLDKNPAAGRFEIAELAWGDYVLSETKAPAGYELDGTEHRFTIDASHLKHEFGTPFVNKKKQPPTLPLTGGISRDFYTLIGAVVIAAGITAVTALRIRRRKQEV